MIHFIPDIHGYNDKLQKALTTLGFFKRAGHWHHSHGDTLVFLGDFIDRGPQNLAVLETVRDLIEDGLARAVMGNHELNAIHYHECVEGSSVRARTQRNTDQHLAFLKELPLGDPQTKAWINWMATLPLSLEDTTFRAVHACWDAGAVQRTQNLDKDTLIRAGLKIHPLHDDVELLTKGPELALPEGYFVEDAQGVKRTRIRLKWWGQDAPTWAAKAISVPNPAQLPSGPLPTSATTYLDTKPVFFGHYWLEGDVDLSDTAICLDYSVAKGGPLVSCAWHNQDALSLRDITFH